MLGDWCLALCYLPSSILPIRLTSTLTLNQPLIKVEHGLISPLSPTCYKPKIRPENKGIKPNTNRHKPKNYPSLSLIQGENARHEIWRFSGAWMLALGAFTLPSSILCLRFTRLPARAGCDTVTSIRPNPIPHQIPRYLDVFPVHMPEELMIPRGAIIMIMRWLRIKGEVRPIVLERPERPPRMIPRRHDDRAVELFRAHHLDRKLGILPRRLGIALQLNRARRHTQLQQDMTIDFIIAGARQKDARRGVLKIKLRRMLRPFVRATSAQHNDDISLMRTAIQRHESLREKIQHDGQHQQEHQKNHRDFPQPFSPTNHSRDNYRFTGRGKSSNTGYFTCLHSPNPHGAANFL